MTDTTDILAAATGTKSDDLLVPAALPPPPPPPPPKKYPNKGILLSIGLFLLLTIPLSVKLISDQRQLAEIRARASCDECLGAGNTPSECRSSCNIESPGLDLTPPEQAQQSVERDNERYSVEQDNIRYAEEHKDYDFTQNQNIQNPTESSQQQTPNTISGPPDDRQDKRDQQTQQKSSGPVCGNGTCESGEDGFSCYQDCARSSIDWDVTPMPLPAPPAPNAQSGSPDDRQKRRDQATDPCYCNEEKNVFEGAGCTKIGQTCGIAIVDRRPTSYCKSSVIDFCEANYSFCKPDSNGGSCGDFQPPPTAPKPTGTAVSAKGYCDRSSPNTDGCTDKNEGAACSIRGGGNGTCRVTMSGGANAECACVASGPPPPGGGQPTGGGDGVSSLSTTPSAPQCQNIKVYKAGQVVTPSTLQVGDEVLLAAVAPTAATKTRFRVNGSSWTETTSKNGTNEFTLAFTIPSQTTNFTIETQLFINGQWQ